MLPPSETAMTVLVAKSQIPLFTRSSIGTPPLDQPEKSKLPPPRNGSARGCACGEQMIVLDKQFVANTVVYTSVADKRIRSIWGK